MELINELIRDKTNLNTTDRNGQTPLHLASRLGFTDNFLRSFFKSVTHLLFWSVRNSGKKEIVQLFIESGADVNAKDHKQETPLFRSSWSGNWLNYFFKSVILKWFWSVRNLGDVGVVKLLLDHGAEINVKNYLGSVPLVKAASNGNWLNYFRRSVILKWLGYVCSEHTGVVKLLLERGADVNAKGNGGMTPLYIAARNGNKELVQFLIERGANVTTRNDDGETPCDIAKSTGNRRTVFKHFREKTVNKYSLVLEIFAGETCA